MKIKTKIKILKILVAALTLILVLIIGGWTFFDSYYQKMNYVPEDEISSSLSDSEIDEFNKEQQDESLVDSPEDEIQSAEDAILENLKNSATQIVSNDNVFNILLMGTDHRSNVAGDRSDSMIVISINSETKKIIMTSFMRDSYVQIPGYGNNRLNAAYAYGGADLLIETIETNFKIDINRYAKVDFYSFMKIVDAIGGVDIEISEAERKVINDYTKELNWIDGVDNNNSVLEHSGLVHLNGRQALGYARIRYVGNADFGRTERQRKILTAAFDKAKDCSIIELNELLNIILPDITTSLTQGECIDILLDSPTYLKYELVSNRVPYDGAWKDMNINKMAVLSLDFEENIKRLQEDIYGENN